ncbi:hypothetical protein PTKIN_Ptkin14bG0155200 [Pterospermum kingtungense]
MEIIEAISETPKAHKRKLDKRLILSLTKPSYLLSLGRVHIRWENRQRLCYLLEKLVAKHKWAEASGVLTILLKGTSNDCSADLNRLKYTESVKLLKHIEGDHQVDRRRIRDIYEIWMSRIRSKTVQVEERIALNLEFILFCLTHGYLGWAHQATLSLMKEPDLSCHPISNLVMGVTFCQLWYSNLSEDVKRRHPNQDYTPQQSETSGSKFSNQIANSEENYAAYTHDAVTSQYNSETSVMNDKRETPVADRQLHTEVPAQNYVNLQSAHIPLEVEQLGSCHNSAENEAGFYNDSGYTCDPSVFSALEGLESWLMPLQLPHCSENFVDMHRQLLNSHYNDAVKYLRMALHAAPPLSAALLPLTQLLLTAGQVNEALSEVKSFCNNSNMPFPFRLKASLLEYFYSNDSVVLSNCVEEILKKDPTSRPSLARLVSIYQNGDYSLESLVEMIALHLEATYPESNIWREFASCFLKLYQYEEDRLSVCLNGNKGEQKANLSINYKRMPKIFTERTSRNAWRLRCKCWSIRYFGKRMLESEIASGAWELLTYKAACASHLYGKEHHYVVKCLS